MIFTIEVTPEDNPDSVGELLRSKFFKANGVDEIGCYTTFEWRDDVEPLPSVPVAQHNHHPEVKAHDYCEACAGGNEMYTRGRKEGIECRWFWDGDGTLAFMIPGSDEWLFNSDCKKSHGWELHKELW